jgi:transposase
MQTTIPGVVSCGLDIHKDKIDACVRVGDGSEEGNVFIKTFSTMRKALFELRDWLISLNCYKVLMESTGVYWMPIYWILEDVDGMNVGLGNSHNLKNVPGRPKTDKDDAKWISRICMFGLILKSFIVAKPFQELREYARYHKKLVQDRARQMNRIEKLLQMHGFKLSSVLSDIHGGSGSKILKKLVEKGELTIDDVKPLMHVRCKSTPEEVACAVTGRMNVGSRLLLKMQIKKMETCDREIEEVFSHMVTMSKEHEWAIDIIASIPGMSTLSALYLIAEIGTDFSSFKSANHLTAWAGVAPKDNESAGKRLRSKTKTANRYVKSLLVQCAWAATKTRNTRVSNWFWRNRGRLGDKKAIIAVARKLLCYIYAMVQSKTPYDRSLDIADTVNIKAKKLDAAKKIIGSQKSIVGAREQGINSNDSFILSGCNATKGQNEPPDSQTEVKQKKSRIKSPHDNFETQTPKKRGRPKKVAAPVGVS